jgi:hypothetical protein
VVLDVEVRVVAAGTAGSVEKLEIDVQPGPR